MKLVSPRNRISPDAPVNSRATTETEKDDSLSKRKRIFSSKSPSSSLQLQTSTTFPDLEEDALPSRNPISLLSNDLNLQILEFCDVSCVRSVMQVNHHYRDLLAAQEATNLWKDTCQRKWKWIQGSSHLIDDLDLPTSAVERPSSQPNHALLLSLASKHQATTIDERILAPCRWNPYLRRFLRLSPTSGTAAHGGLTCVTVKGGDETAIQFNGIIGPGDRCMRADAPLPRPLRTNSQSRRSKLLALLRLQPRAKRRSRQQQCWRPFVAPFLQGRNDVLPPQLPQQQQQVNMTPRLISYFEVSILPESAVFRTRREQLQSSAAVAGFDFQARLLANNNNTTTNNTTTTATTEPSSNDDDNQDTRGETVGIGLATEDFDLHGSMPGWDACSYGFHGDDGGLYHNHGGMIKQLGRTFGAGDTVGCGIDYPNRSIFFTLNGKLLGPAFSKLKTKDLQQDFYPVVGVDSYCPIQCNFVGPFAFDLQGMVKKQQALVLQTLSINH